MLIKSPRKNNLYILTLLMLLAGCAQPPTETVAANHGFKHVYLATGKFNLTSYQKVLRPNAPVRIYIEGDGKAWLSKTRISPDPSPRNSTVMRLAALDPNENVVYLARPCQYSPNDLAAHNANGPCTEKYWSTARYAPDVVQAVHNAITQIKQQANATQIHLIGYSGGATLAVLVAAQRADIASIRTVAGNLDLLAMQNYHRTTPLSESLDPMAVATEVRHIPQLHFIGKKDRVVPAIVAANFVRAAGINPDRIIVVENADHAAHWDDHWESLLKRIP